MSGGLGSGGTNGRAGIAVAVVETIYVELLGEGIDVWRPVDAEPGGDGVYRLLAPFDYDSTLETWRFEPVPWSGANNGCSVRVLAP